MSWTLVPCLVKLRSEFNEIAPTRDKTSDGSIGDAAHSATESDHNPAPDGQVHAIDVDVDLRQPGLSMEIVVQHLLRRCRSGAENRLKYVIYNRRIWSASSSWVQQYYDGVNAHDHHAHFSASYVTAREANTASWHLEELDMALDGTDLGNIKAQVTAAIGDFFDRSGTGGSITSKVGRDANDQGVPNGVTGTNTTTWARDRDIGQQLMIVKSMLAQLLAQGDGTDEAAIVAGVLAGLNPAAIAAAIPLDIAERVADELRDRLAG